MPFSPVGLGRIPRLPISFDLPISSYLCQALIQIIPASFRAAPDREDMQHTVQRAFLRLHAEEACCLYPQGPSPFILEDIDNGIFVIIHRPDVSSSWFDLLILVILSSLVSSLSALYILLFSAAFTTPESVLFVKFFFYFIFTISGYINREIQNTGGLSYLLRKTFCQVLNLFYSTHP